MQNTKTCKNCGEIISKVSIRCVKCANKLSSKKRVKNRRSYKGKKHPNYKHGKTLKKSYCIECNKELSKNAFYYKYKRCLSCSNSLTKTGKNHPNYIDGRKKFPYSEDFTEKLKRKIRKRDNYTCQNCDITEEEHIIVFGQVLHVHHIDYNKENCEENNLISLCISCNTRANYNRKQWKEYYQILMT